MSAGVNRTQSLINHSTRLIHNEEYEEMFGSEIEFLEHQKQSTEKAYTSWIKCLIIVNIGILIYSIVLMIYWLYEIYLIGTNGINCEKIKGLMICLVITYIIGMISHIICFISAYLRSIFGFVLYLLLLLTVFVLRITFDVNLIDLIIQNLNGCTQQDFTTTPKQFIVSSVIYCTIILLLVAYSSKIIYIIRRMNKARRLFRDYSLRNQKQISVYN
jgi:hypothetical protein